MTLKQGSKGADVKKWQEWLISRNLRIDADSDFGPATEKATKEWQQRAGLDADGKVGAKTLAKAVELGFKGLVGIAPVLITKPDTKTPDSHTVIFKGGSATDKHNRAMISRLHPELQKRAMAFLDAAKKDGWELRIVQSLRTFAEQDALYAQGRTKSGEVVTNARGGQSLHNFGLAADFAPVVEGKISWNEQHYRLFGKWADVARLEWGGRWSRFKDLPHVQLPKSPKTATLLAWYRGGGLAEVWKNVG